MYGNCVSDSNVRDNGRAVRPQGCDEAKTATKCGGRCPTRNILTDGWPTEYAHYTLLNGNVLLRLCLSIAPTLPVTVLIYLHLTISFYDSNRYNSHNRRRHA